MHQELAAAAEAVLRATIGGSPKVTAPLFCKTDPRWGGHATNGRLSRLFDLGKGKGDSWVPIIKRKKERKREKEKKMLVI